MQDKVLEPSALNSIAKTVPIGSKIIFKLQLEAHSIVQETLQTLSGERGGIRHAAVEQPAKQMLRSSESASGLW